MLAAQRAGVGAGEVDVAARELLDLVERLVKVDGRALGLRQRRAVGQLVGGSACDGSDGQTKSQSHCDAENLFHTNTSCI